MSTKSEVLVLKGAYLRISEAEKTAAITAYGYLREQSPKLSEYLQALSDEAKLAFADIIAHNPIF